MPHALQRPILATLLVTLAICAPATTAQPAPRAPQTSAERTVLHAYTLRHRPAAEAFRLVQPMLSPRGSAVVQASTNTLVLRDTVASLSRILPVLRGFDRPLASYRLEVLIVRASRTQVSPAEQSTAPPELVAKLRKLLPYDVYELTARAELETAPGDDVTYEVGEGYSLRFRTGEMTPAHQLKLRDFQLFQQGRDEPMIHTNLLLFLAKTYTLGFSKNHTSPTALMVILTCRPAAPEDGEGGGGR